MAMFSETRDCGKLSFCCVDNDTSYTMPMTLLACIVQRHQAQHRAKLLTSEHFWDGLGIAGIVRSVSGSAICSIDCYSIFSAVSSAATGTAPSLPYP